MFVFSSGSSYYSVVGPKGSGKSWVVQQAVEKVHIFPWLLCKSRASQNWLP